jgi:hypothetical protein
MPLLKSVGQFFGDVGILGSPISPNDTFDRNLALAAEQRMEARWQGVVRGVSDWGHNLVSTNPLMQGRSLFTAATFFGGGAALRDLRGVGKELSYSTQNSVDLYRAIKPNEVNQILQTKSFINPYGIENKYFSTTLEGALQYARMAENAFGDPPYTIIKTSMLESNFNDIPLDLKETVDRGINAILVPTNTLPLLSAPKILDEQLIGETLNRRLFNVNP